MDKETENNFNEEWEGKEMVKIFMKIDNRLIEIAVVETVEAAKDFIEMLTKNYMVAPYFYKVIQRSI